MIIISSEVVSNDVKSYLLGFHTHKKLIKFIWYTGSYS